MLWPPRYTAEFARRAWLLSQLRANPDRIPAAHNMYGSGLEGLKLFIRDWGVTYDPRNAGTDTPVYLPFLTFKRQREFIEFIWSCLNEEADALIEKSRDMGATWLCVAISVWLWLYWDGVAIGWGSRKEPLVDHLGDPDSIFEKVRIFIRRLPKELWPVGFDPKVHMPFMKVVNPATGATITGEIGDNIGRGGRKKIYFKDESAHYEHPEMIEASLGDNTNIQVDISSVHGLGTVFERKRESGIEWNPGQKAIKGQTNVFIMDWSDHPAKDKTWHDMRKAKAIREGLYHVFASEVDRDYAASVEGIIIPAEWVQAAIDAHLKLDYLGDWDLGLWGAGLDVADEGLDRNALAIRKGPILRGLGEWSERDVGATTRKAIVMLRDLTPLQLQYDCIGVGAGVKSEANRLKDDMDNPMPSGLLLVPWNAGAAVLYPERRVVEPSPDADEDEKRSSPKNKDFYTNLKAQAWWELRRRFEKTFKAVTEGEYYDLDELISLDSTIPLIRSAQKELSTPSAGLGAKLKLLINKKPDGAKSPNLGDAIVMAFWPVPPPPSGEGYMGVQTLGAGRR